MKTAILISKEGFFKTMEVADEHSLISIPRDAEADASMPRNEANWYVGDIMKFDFIAYAGKFLIYIER